MNGAQAEDIAGYLDLAQTLADAAGEAIRPYFRTAIDVEDKADKGPGHYSPVTEADRGAEAAMRALIRERYPAHGILGEEYGLENPAASHVWVLDPIDGTKAFISGVPIWGTLIGLVCEGQPLIGVMDQPILGERFVGGPEGAFLGEQRIKTRACAKLDRATLCITDLDMLTTEAQHEAFEAVSTQVALRRVGGDCYNYAMLALGFIDLVIEGSLAPWDIQALIPIVQSAGGVITAWDGTPVKEGGWVVAAGDPNLHAKVMPLLAPAMPK